jgi:hypothetical protein
MLYAMRVLVTLTRQRIRKKPLMVPLSSLTREVAVLSKF